LLALGIDTATPVTSVAVGAEEGTRAAVAVRQQRGHAELLAPSVRWALDRAGAEPGSLGGIAIGVGPGLFTGLRVGVATAKALAQAWRLPMVAVSSLDLLAFAHRHAARTVCAVIDARRREVFAAMYRHAPGGIQRVTRYAVMRPDRLAAELEARREDVLLCGEGALVHAGAFEHLDEHVHLAGSTGSTPDAAALVELALPRFHREEFTRPLDVTPMYLRHPDVDPNLERRLAAERAGAGPARPGPGA
jgi:tRNA threonylcarbamoyladenosine biosynthesis protein TsaB